MRDRLERPDRTPELLAGLRVVDREIERRLGRAAIAGSGGDALDLQAGEQAVEPAIDAADKALVGSLDIVEEDLVGPDAAPTQHVELAQLDAGRVVVDEEQ